ncbi:MAG: glutathione S-transferase family protein [Maritimibacter sp.]
MIRLHAIPGSRSFRILWLMEELGMQPDEIINYSIMDGSLRTDAYRELNPAGRVPALEIDGMVLTESGAITQYLLETRPDHKLAPEVGAPNRGAFLQWLHFSESVAVLIQNLNMQHLFLPDPSMQSPVVMGLETRRLAGLLKVAEGALADGRETLMPEGFSAADTMFGFNISAAFHYVHKEKFPRLQAYLARMQARPASQRAMLAQGEDVFYTKDFYPLPEGA